MMNLLGQVQRGYLATMEGGRRIVGSPKGVAIDHLDDESVLLVFGEDFDYPRIDKYYWDKINESLNPCIFITRDLLPAVPYTDENVFTMQRISDREFSMIPVKGGASSVASLF